jgi:hypothetical protein
MVQYLKAKGTGQQAKGKECATGWILAFFLGPLALFL